MRPRPAARGALAALAATLLLALPQDAALAASPPAQDSGINSLMPAPPGIQQGNQATLMERYPLEAYTMFNVDVGDLATGLLPIGPPGLPVGPSDGTSGAGNVIANYAASVVMGLCAVIALLTVRLVEWAFSWDLAGPAGAPLTSVVQGLHDGIYVPLLPIACLLLAIWLVWHVLARRRTMHGLQGAGWALGAMVAAALYFSAPAQVLGALDSGAGLLSRATLAAIGSGDPSLASRSQDPSLAQGDAADAELRSFADRFWTNLVFEPWAVATFGSPQDGQRYGQELLAKLSGDPSNFDSDFNGGASKQAKDWYGGKYGTMRLLICLVALAVVVIASVLCLIMAGTLLVAQLALLLLLMLAPIFLLAGVHPGAGRRMLVRWAELAAGSLLLWVLSGAFLAVLLVLSGVINQVGAWGQGGLATGSWLLSAFLQAALFAAALVYRKPFLRVFGQVASPRFAQSHLSHPATARGAHSLMDKASGLVHRRAVRAAAQATGGRAGAAAGKAAAARGATAAGKGAATAVTGVSTAGVALAALEAGKVATRWGARATRAMQGHAGHFVVGPGGGTPPKPTFASTPARRMPLLMRAQPPAPEKPERPERKENPQPKPRGATYTHHQTGETVTTTSKIILPGAWHRERKA